MAKGPIAWSARWVALTSPVPWVALLAGRLVRLLLALVRLVLFEVARLLVFGAPRLVLFEAARVVLFEAAPALFFGAPRLLLFEAAPALFFGAPRLLLFEAARPLELAPERLPEPELARARDPEFFPDAFSVPARCRRACPVRWAMTPPSQH